MRFRYFHIFLLLISVLKVPLHPTPQPPYSVTRSSLTLTDLSQETIFIFIDQLWKNEEAIQDRKGEAMKRT